MAKRCKVILFSLMFALAADCAQAGWLDDAAQTVSSGWDAVTGVFTGSTPEQEIQNASNDQGKLPEYISDEWDKLTNNLLKALDLKDENETLPESAWFGKDKNSNNKRINKLLDIAVKILMQGNPIDLRKQAAELRAKGADLRAEADKLRNKRITAPEKSKMPWGDTRSSIDKNLAELEQSIKDNENALKQLDESLAGAMREIGLELTQEQIDVLLSSVTGDDLLQNTVIFANVKKVVEKLADLSKGDNNNLDINRRYTGMYLVLNDLLIYTQSGLVQKIDKDYRPRLEKIITEADAVRRDALSKSRSKNYNDAQRSTFKLNAEANEMTIKVARLYIELLKTQRTSINNNLKDLIKNRDVAESTYRTVKSSGDLRNLIHSGLELFDSIHSLSMPELQPFESDAMRREFEEINKRLKK
ncbi:MAG: hypothetical protein IJ520_01235 [Synergistaceae bacterium]|nr:hypothetical protein [Synergistaceae bacterium]